MARPVRLDVLGQRRLERAAAHGTHGLVVLQAVRQRVAVVRPAARHAPLRGNTGSHRVRERSLLAPVVERVEQRLVLRALGTAFAVLLHAGRRCLVDGCSVRRAIAVAAVVLFRVHDHLSARDDRHPPVAPRLPHPTARLFRVHRHFR